MTPHSVVTFPVLPIKEQAAVAAKAATADRMFANANVPEAIALILNFEKSDVCHACGGTDVYVCAVEVSLIFFSFQELRMRNSESAQKIVRTAFVSPKTDVSTSGYDGFLVFV